MSSITQPFNTGQQLTSVYDLSKIFVWGNRYETDNYINNSNYAPITLLAGTVMGRVALTNYLKPTDASQSDGSQHPIGVLRQDVVVPGGGTQQVSICVSGDVVESKLIWWTGNAGTTVMNGRQLRDWLQGNSVGIKLVPGTEMTQADNT